MGFILESLKLNYKERPDYGKIDPTGKTGPTFFTAAFVSKKCVCVNDHI